VGSGFLALAPGLLASQLLPADGVQCGEVVAHDVPENIVGDFLVLAPEDISDTGDLWPRDLRVPGLQFAGKMPACFGNDLNAAFNESTLSPIGSKNSETDALHL
jgi:hypothetical protein